MKLYIGEQIKALRKEHSLTQEQFADILGVSYQSVSRWELGMCYPDMELLPTIANFFGVSTDHLLTNDPISKEADIKRFYDQVNVFPFASLEQLQFIENFVRKYPDNDRFAHILLNTMTHYVLRNEDERATYIPYAVKLFERLNNTNYREAALQNIICICDENELDNWLNLCSWSPEYTRRGCLIYRFIQHDDWQKSHIQQSIEMFENLATQLDRRFPDSFGPTRKADYHRAVMNTIRSFGEDAVPDGWGYFYAYKQLVLAACLFGDGKIEEGTVELKAALALYSRLWENSDEWLSLGNALFGNMKINRTYTAILDIEGNVYPVFGGNYVCFPDANHVYSLLTDPAWTWFDSVREKDFYKAAVEFVKCTM